MKGYSFFKVRKLAPHHQMMFSVISGHSLGILSLCRDAIGVIYGLNRLAGLVTDCSAYKIPFSNNTGRQQVTSLEVALTFSRSAVGIFYSCTRESGLKTSLVYIYIYIYIYVCVCVCVCVCVWDRQRERERERKKKRESEREREIYMKEKPR